jgi:glycosyltransferase involved in cell wall biosynthesis
MKIKFTGPLLDGSGYAEFGRNFLASLALQPNVELAAGMFSCERERTDLGAKGELAKHYLSVDMPRPDIHIYNSTPEIFQSMSTSTSSLGTKNVCFTMWETSHIPSIWHSLLEQHADAVLVPCAWNKELFIQSKISIPTYVVNPGFDLSVYNDIEIIQPFELDTKYKDSYIFYSIFQWTERKNPAGLIRAYYSAFDNNENVVLVLKTYRASYATKEVQAIQEEIKKIKSNMLLKNPPKIVFISDQLTDGQMLALHRRCNCFILPHRAEGWGMPHMQAMAMGNPCISTNFSGNLDFMNKDNSYLVDYQMTPVCNMPWSPWYQGFMEWAEPNLSQLKHYMLYCYQNQINAKATGLQGRKTILSKFTWEQCGANLVKTCKEILCNQ